jgi:hypothetical protein
MALSGRQVTGLIVVGAITTAAVYDVYAEIHYGNEATISRLCLETSQQYRGFTICLMLGTGILIGHLLLPQHEA